MDLGVRQAGLDESEADGGLFDALAEVTFVERETQVAVLEHVVGARLIVASSGCFSFQVEAL